MHPSATRPSIYVCTVWIKASIPHTVAHTCAGELAVRALEVHLPRDCALDGAAQGVEVGGRQVDGRGGQQRGPRAHRLAAAVELLSREGGQAAAAAAATGALLPAAAAGIEGQGGRELDPAGEVLELFGGWGSGGGGGGAG